MIWLRYLAAFSIVFSHTRHFDTAPQTYSAVVGKITWLYPGVPVLLFISGFVISLSYSTASPYAPYIIKRILRIYPPLWASFVVSIVLLFSTGVLQPENIDWLTFLAWSAGQLTLVFFYHPDFLEHFGIGVLNGSLWVIPVILQFYLLLPLIKRLDTHWLSKNKPYLMYLLLLSAGLFNTAFHYVHNFHESNLTKVIHFLTVLPWLFFFLLGYVFSRDFHKFRKSGLLGWAPWLALHFILFWILSELGFKWGRNDINPVLFTVLGIVILNIGYAPASKFQWLNKTENFLARNDISFGIFVYHMVVLNLMYHFGIFDEQWTARLLTLIIGTITLSSFSLIVLEKPIRLQRDRIIALFTNEDH